MNVRIINYDYSQIRLIGSISHSLRFKSYLSLYENDLKYV